jgi:hypothetical protein
MTKLGFTLSRYGQELPARVDFTTSISALFAESSSSLKP